MSVHSSPWLEALKLARKGIPVFPCINKPGEDADKRPLTPHGFKDASADGNLVHEWWTRWPDALVAIPPAVRCSPPARGPHHAEARPGSANHRASLPLARARVARSRARHRPCTPNPKVGCTTNKLGPHIDTRGLGGYIIWWPAHGHEV